MLDGNNTHMFSELHEIPEVVKKATLISDEECRRINSILFGRENLILTGMGSSFFLAEIGKLYFQELGNKENISVDSADNVLLSHSKLFNNSSTILAFSQSGNTQEVDEVLAAANDAGVQTYGVYNNPGSKIESRAQDSFLLGVGKEQSPVSTKYIASALSILYRLAVEASDLQPTVKTSYLSDLEKLSLQLEQVLKSLNSEIKEQVTRYKNGDHFIALGNGILRSVAKEVSLKIRETVGVFSAYEDDGQLKHGGINSLGEQSIVLGYNSSLELLERIQQRGSKLIQFGGEASSISHPQSNTFLEPLISIVVTQLFIHHLSVSMGINTDIKMW